MVLAWGNVSLPPGTYSLSAPENVSGSSTCGGYATYGFQSWSASANLTVQNPSFNRTNVTVRGAGVLSALYKGWNGPWVCSSLSWTGSGCGNPAFLLGVVVLMVGVAAIAVVVIVRVALTRRRKVPPASSSP